MTVLVFKTSRNQMAVLAPLLYCWTIVLLFKPSLCCKSAPLCSITAPAASTSRTRKLFRPFRVSWQRVKPIQILILAIQLLRCILAQYISTVGATHLRVAIWTSPLGRLFFV
ncbi:hypothetical protein K438DRAFT_574679 [Mycena galopus ATCC 62051]|nr:hypothetical protein K438DRAFT_574679 [Mycena galopus ATCC 62051]